MILFACPLMFLLLPLPFLVRRFLPPVKGLHGDALRVPFLRDIADISIRSGGMWRAAAAGGEKTSPTFWWLCLVWLFLTVAAARPISNASSQVSSVFATPRTPSVPNNLPIKSGSSFPSGVFYNDRRAGIFAESGRTRAKKRFAQLLHYMCLPV